MKESKAKYSAFDTAAYFLSFRDRSAKEIEDKLKEKGYSSDEIEEAVRKLKTYGYINDENYALSYIKSNMRKKGSKLIAIELNRKGIDKDTISNQIDCVDIDEKQAILDVIERKYSNLEDEKVRRRAYAYFMRKGYKSEDISNAFSNYMK